MTLHMDSSMEATAFIKFNYVYMMLSTGHKNGRPRKSVKSPSLEGFSGRKIFIHLRR